MGTIRHLPFVNRYQGAPTDYVLHLSKGKLIHEGLGEAFFFLKAVSALAEVPAIDHEYSGIVHAVTSDRQDLAVQSVVTYRFVQPALVAQRFDFNVYPVHSESGGPQGERQVSQLIQQLAHAVTIDVLSHMTMLDALKDGLALVQSALVEQLTTQERLQDSGIAVIDVRVLSLRPVPEVEKALQTPLREQLQAEADRALYERRAQAVEQEQRISENELASKLELARRQEELLTQEAANERLQAEEQAKASLIAANAKAEATQIQETARAAAIRSIGQAEAENERERLNAYNVVAPEVLHALALRELAQNLPSIGQINLTPDMLTPLLSQFLTPSEK